MADPKEILRDILAEAVRKLAPEAGSIEIHLERPKNPEHGDLSSNVAFTLARRLRRNPGEIAEQLVAATAEPVLRSEVFEMPSCEAGFYNVRQRAASKKAIVHRVLAEGPDFGRVRAARAQKILIEFVSANPTGPLHVGHGRGAAYGASLAGLLEFAGAEVSREYYVNDAGRQMDILALSVWLRYLQARGAVAPFPEDAYRGDYVREIAARLSDLHAVRFDRNIDIPGFAEMAEGGDQGLDRLIETAKKLLGEDWRLVHRFALEEMLAEHRGDLAEFRVEFDRWFAESSLHESGAVQRIVSRLGQAGQLYEKDGALWFRASAFGDEKDRVVRRENGQYTYFASDIAYHADKFARGFERLIDVWGADHHGYLPRVAAALKALGLPAESLTVALVQFAVLYRGGERIAMGKRSGEFVTLRELRDEVGNDAARFFYVLRRPDQHLDFDLDLAKSESHDNPVYYVQYAHARLCSLFAQWGGDPARLARAALEPLEGERELALMPRLAEFPELVVSAARELAPHAIAFYLRELAAEFHSYYNAERILVEDAALREARLALCAAVRQTLANGLALLGVSAPERM